MLGVVITAYREFVSWVDILITRGLSKPDRVREIIRSTTGKITKTQIMRQCPDISQKTVERALADVRIMEKQTNILPMLQREKKANDCL